MKPRQTFLSWCLAILGVTAIPDTPAVLRFVTENSLEVAMKNLGNVHVPLWCFQENFLKIDQEARAKIMEYLVLSYDGNDILNVIQSGGNLNILIIPNGGIIQFFKHDFEEY